MGTTSRTERRKVAREGRVEAERSARDADLNEIAAIVRRLVDAVEPDGEPSAADMDRKAEAERKAERVNELLAALR